MGKVTHYFSLALLAILPLTGMSESICKRYSMTMADDAEIQLKPPARSGHPLCQCVISASSPQDTLTVTGNITSPAAHCNKTGCASCQPQQIISVSFNGSLAIVARYNPQSSQRLDSVLYITGGTSEKKIECGKSARILGLVNSAPKTLEIKECASISGLPKLSNSPPAVIGQSNTSSAPDRGQNDTSVITVTPGGSTVVMAVTGGAKTGSGNLVNTTGPAAVTSEKEGLDNVLVITIAAVVGGVVLLLLLLVVYILCNADRFCKNRSREAHVKAEEEKKQKPPTTNGTVSTGFDPPKFETYIDAYNNESSTDDLDDNVLNQDTHMNGVIPREIQLIDRAIQSETSRLPSWESETDDKPIPPPIPAPAPPPPKSDFKKLPQQGFISDQGSWKYTKGPAPVPPPPPPPPLPPPPVEEPKPEKAVNRQLSSTSSDLPFLAEMQRKQAERDSGIFGGRYSPYAAKKSENSQNNPAFEPDTASNASNEYAQIDRNMRKTEPPPNEHIPAKFRELFYPDRPPTPDDTLVNRTNPLYDDHDDNNETDVDNLDPVPKTPESLYIGDFILKPKENQTRSASTGRNANDLYSNPQQTQSTRSNPSENLYSYRDTLPQPSADDDFDQDLPSPSPPPPPLPPPLMFNFPPEAPVAPPVPPPPLPPQQQPAPHISRVHIPPMGDMSPPPPPEFSSQPPAKAHAPMAVHPRHGRYRRVKAAHLPYYQQQQEEEEADIQIPLRQSSHMIQGNRYFALMNNELVMMKTDQDEDSLR